MITGFVLAFGTGVGCGFLPIKSVRTRACIAGAAGAAIALILSKMSLP